jgi:hypothetical protein
VFVFGRSARLLYVEPPPGSGRVRQESKREKFMKPKRRPAVSLFGLLAAIPLVLGASCSVLGVDGYDDERERLEAARAAWQAQGIDSYSYVLQRSCFCGGGTTPAVVVVEAGERVSVTAVASGEPIDAPFAELYLTIDELFDFVEDAIDRKAHEITVSYDAERGIPLSVSIDYDENTIDEEMAFMASQFQPGSND